MGSTHAPYPDLKTISRFSQLEYKLGDPERGKTIFEGIVDSHPKRWDLWTVYIDMEASQNNVVSIRYVHGFNLSRHNTHRHIATCSTVFLP